MKVLVLGAGKMVEAILTGLVGKVNMTEWGIYSPSGKSASALALKVGAQPIQVLNDFHPDWIMVGCKPQQIHDLSTTLNGQFKDKIFISLLAALGEDQQLKVLGVKKLIRAMPNLPVAQRSGVTLLSSRSAPETLKDVQKLFSHLGEALLVQENELEELTLLTGSGPAFFYEFTKDLAASFTSLSSEERERLARLVLKGAALSTSADSRALGELTQGVTSKGGVTIAVLERWRELRFSKMISEGIEAGKKRTNELKAILLRQN